MFKKNVMKPGDVVAIIENGAIKKGILKKKFDFQTDQAIVDFNGTLRKVWLKDLAKIENNDIEKENDENIKDRANYLSGNQKEKSEITITPESFRNIGLKVVCEETKKSGSAGGLLRLSFAVLLAKLHQALFIYL